MDGDLFQGVLLGLLALGVIVLVALLATLGGIRRALEQRASQSSSQPELDNSSQAEAASETVPESETATPEPTPAEEEQPGAVASTATGQAETIRGVLQQHGLQGQETSTPAATTTAQEGSTPEEQVVDSAFAAHADDPQEEPFQRDGRWWFKRGDELLLYDEASGQWQPAPEGSDEPVTGGTAAAGGTATEAATQTQPVATTTEATPAVADQVATYWKCPTCGAVNGSTAATCRMCFAARP